MMTPQPHRHVCGDDLLASVLWDSYDCCAGSGGYAVSAARLGGLSSRPVKRVPVSSQPARPPERQATAAAGQAASSWRCSGGEAVSGWAGCRIATLSPPCPCPPAPAVTAPRPSSLGPAGQQQPGPGQPLRPGFAAGGRPCGLQPSSCCSAAQPGSGSAGSL
ncbi:hypothetical protein HaLaN_22288, partial [Haematococcus lacustris]